MPPGRTIREKFNSLSLALQHLVNPRAYRLAKPEDKAALDADLEAFRGQAEDFKTITGSGDFSRKAPAYMSAEWVAGLREEMERLFTRVDDYKTGARTTRIGELSDDLKGSARELGKLNKQIAEIIGFGNIAAETKAPSGQDAEEKARQLAQAVRDATILGRPLAAPKPFRLKKAAPFPSWL